MNTQVVYVVGDRFKNFSSNQGVISISEMEQMTDMVHIGPALNRVYLIGQGIGTKRLRSLQSKIKNSKLEKYFKIKNASDIAHEENQKSVHKQKVENVMITVPVPYDTDTYQSNLILDDDCAEISDHMTGQHIQGMVLIEAARQMMLSVTEYYILQPEQRGKSYFVLNNINTLFRHFAFPLGMTVTYKILEVEKTAKGNVKSKALVGFIQNNKTIAEIEISFSVYDQAFISQKENEMAAKLIEDSQSTDLSFYTKGISAESLMKKRACA